MDDITSSIRNALRPRPPSWHRRAKGLQAGDDLVGAIHAWRRAHASGDEDLEHMADKGLASLFVHLGRSADAAPHLRALALKDPEDPSPWRELGRCYKLMGRVREEAEAWRALLGLLPDDPEALRRLAAPGLNAYEAPRRATAPPATVAEGLAEGARLQAAGDLEGAAAIYRAMQPGLRQHIWRRRPEGFVARGPDFLIIGPSRTGTSWLVRALARHPQAFILSGEPHYFSAWADQPPQAYVDRFAAPEARFASKPESAWPLVGERAVLGEKSPLYLTMADDRIELCAALYPKARLICLVRDPIERAWSHIKQLGLETRAEDLDHLKSGRAPLRLAELLEEGRYEDHLKRWSRFFSSERIHLIDHARIADDPNGVYDETVAFLGLEPMRPRKMRAPEVRVGTSERPPETLLRYLEASYAGETFDLDALRRAMVKAHKAAKSDAVASRSQLQPGLDGLRQA